jgi:hypothetical protein
VGTEGTEPVGAGGAGSVPLPTFAAIPGGRELDDELCLMGCTREHVVQLREWVVSSNVYADPIREHGRLVYKATRDGFKAGDYHRMCDGQGRLLCIIREKTGGWLFGGFTSIPAESPTREQWHADPTAFLFTLTNPHGIPPTRYVNIGAEYAVSTGAYSHFALGYKPGEGSDLDIAPASNTNTSELISVHANIKYATISSHSRRVCRITHLWLPHHLY